MTTPFSIKEAFLFGWHTVRAHSGLVFQVVLTLLAIQIVQAIVGKTLEHTALGALASVVLGVGGAVVGIGATVISLRLAAHAHTSYNDLIPPWGIIWRFVVAGIAAGVIIVLPLLGAGVLALITGLLSLASFVSFSEGGTLAPLAAGAAQLIATGLLLAVGAAGSIYLAVRYSMVRYAVIDHAGVRGSLHKSWRMTQGVMWKLLLFVLAALVLNLLGAIPFGLGLLITLPVTMIAFAHVYLKLKGHHAA